MELGVLRSHIAAITRFVELLDPTSLTGESAAQLVTTFSAAENACSAGKVLCARRAADARWHEREGHKDAASWLAGVTGDSRGAASDALATASALGDLPGLNDAFRSGELSPRQAAEVARAASADPSAEDDLLDVARRSSLGELRSKGDAVRAAKHSKDEADARHERIRAARRLETWEGSEGSFMGRFSLTPEDGATLMSRLEAIANELFDQARREQRQEPRKAYLADALVGLAADGPSPTAGDASDPDQAAQTGRGGRPGYKIVMHADVDALIRGYLLPGEECTIDGIGPVAVSVVQRYFDVAELCLVATKNTEIAWVTSFSRTIPTALRTALEYRDRKCVVPGCDSAFHLEIDHIQAFAKGGPTSLANLCRLCRFHHRLKTLGRYRLEGGPGHWRWVQTHGAGPPGTAPPRAVEPDPPPVRRPAPVTPPPPMALQASLL